jgi:mono/diheme cytochrome c family protein
MRKRTLAFLAIIAGLAGGAIFGWMTIRRGFSARDNPSRMEAMMARDARNMSIPAAERNARNPFTATPEVLKEGREHFADHCATCHANDGSGATEMGPNFYPKVPDMRQSPTQNLTDGQIHYIIQNGVRFTGMPAWGAIHSDDDTWKLVIFIRHLPQLTADEKKDMQRFNPVSPADEMEEHQEQLSTGSQQSGEPAGEPHHHHQ